MRNKVRIIGGAWRSRVITFPDSADLRPTPDRVRETVFNWLGQDLTGKICLDLFAGSGAMGFEAASRGAERVIMVDPNPSVFKALQASVQKLAAKQIELVAMDALKFAASDVVLKFGQFDVIFLDPPFRLRLELLTKLLPLLAPHLAEGGLVYTESENPFDPGLGWLAWRRGRAGKVHYQLLKLLSVP